MMGISDYISLATKCEQMAMKFFARADFYYEQGTYGDSLWADKLVERAVSLANRAVHYYREASIARN